MVLPSVPHSLPRHGTVFWNLEAAELAFPETAAKSMKEWIIFSTMSASLITETLILKKETGSQYRLGQPWLYTWDQNKFSKIIILLLKHI
jgi:hypothetical protein